MPTSEKVAALKDLFNKANQGHVFSFFDSLPEAEQESLYKDLVAIDPVYCNNIFKKATSGDPNADTSLSPLPEAAFDSTMDALPAKIKAWYDAGMKLIAQGKVGVILMAGGQGTRLGSSAPKGCYDIQLPSHKSLFQLQAERIVRLQDLATVLNGGKKVVIPWYIMKLGSATDEYFKQNNYFGLAAENVVFFEQGTLPAFTMEGKILLENKSKVSVAPDGNGGIYRALRTSGILDDMAKRGVEFLHAYCVDNCLVRVADPVFIGYCVAKGAECGAKVVRKREPTEAVGVICLKGSKPSVVEYSEIDAGMAAQTKPDGTLVYGAANIANHFYTLSFLQRVKDFEQSLEYHVAKKKIKHVSIPDGTLQSPEKPNGIKLELFVFDVFPYVSLSKFAVLEADRVDEFSPLKNAPGAGVDCPETSRADILAQHVRFVEAAGGKVVKAADEATPVLELSPLVTYGGEGLEIVNGATIKTPALVSSLDELKKLVGK